MYPTYNHGYGFRLWSFSFFFKVPVDSIIFRIKPREVKGCLGDYDK